MGSNQHESGSTPLPELGDKRSQGGKAQGDEEHKAQPFDVGGRLFGSETRPLRLRRFCDAWVHACTPGGWLFGRGHGRFSLFFSVFSYFLSFFEEKKFRNFLKRQIIFQVKLWRGRKKFQNFLMK